MSKEFFTYPETAKLFDLLEETSHRSAVSRAVVFEDFLTMSVCALSGGRMEELYLQTVAKHTAGKPGRRGCDSLSLMFGELVAAMEQDSRDDMKDILGDLFEGGITYGEHQQYLTPMPVCTAMARMTVEAHEQDFPSESDLVGPPEDVPESVPADSEGCSSEPRKTVFDPTCGSGRMLLAVAQLHRDWEFYGQDIDLRCVRITALNLAFRNLYGYVTWGNTLALEEKLVYRTGFDGRGFVRELPPAACPQTVQRTATNLPPTTPIDQESLESDDDRPTPKQQGRLF